MVLDSFMGGSWMKGLTEYTAVSEIQSVPQEAHHCVFKRRQFKTNVERLRRRRMKRHEEDYNEAAAAIPSEVAQRPNLPFATIRSQSTQQRFQLFIEREETQSEPVSGSFNYYGLSDGTTVPWF